MSPTRFRSPPERLNRPITPRIGIDRPTRASAVRSGRVNRFRQAKDTMRLSPPPWARPRLAATHSHRCRGGALEDCNRSIPVQEEIAHVRVALANACAVAGRCSTRRRCDASDPTIEDTGDDRQAESAAVPDAPHPPSGHPLPGERVESRDRISSLLHRRRARGSSTRGRAAAPVPADSTRPAPAWAGHLHRGHRRGPATTA